jgi:hypothetical protein
MTTTTTKKKPKAERTLRKCAQCKKESKMLPSQKFCCDSCRATFSRETRDAALHARIAELEAALKECRDGKAPKNA